MSLSRSEPFSILPAASIRGESVESGLLCNVHVLVGNWISTRFFEGTKTGDEEGRLIETASAIVFVQK